MSIVKKLWNLLFDKIDRILFGRWPMRYKKYNSSFHDDKKWLLIDLRMRDDYKMYPGLKGSINITKTNFEWNIDNTMAKHKGKKVLLIDDSDKSCPRYSRILTNLGYKNIFILKDGLKGIGYQTDDKKNTDPKHQT